MDPVLTPAVARQESPVRRTVGASVLAAVSLGLKIGSNLIIIPVALKYLGREEYAVWIILQSIAMYLTMSELGVGQTVANFQNAAFERGNYSEVSRILTTTFGLNWLTAVPVWVMFAFVLLTMPVEHWLLKDVSVGAATGFKVLLLLAGTLALFRVPLQVFSATLLGLRELVLRQVIDGAYAVFLLVGTVLTLLLGGKVLSLILVTNLGFIGITLLSYPLARARHAGVSVATRFWTPKLVWPLFGNSIFFFLYNLGLFFQRLAGNVLAGKFGSLRQVPEMFVLLTLFRVVGWSLADILSQTLLPYVNRLPMQGRHDRMVFFAKLCTKFTVTLAIVYSGLIWLFADIGIRWWLGPGMFLGWGPLACLAGGFLIDVLFLSTNNFMRGLNRHHRLSVVMAVYALVSFVLGVVGAKWWMPDDPLYGLCAGLLVASVMTQALALPWVTCRGLEISWRPYVWHFIIRPCFLIALGLAVVGGFTDTGTGEIWNRVVRTLAVVLALPSLAWILLLDREERDWVGSLLSKLRLPESGNRQSVAAVDG
jgi:O-antigen/teichoic acid export membrane protein